METSTCRYEKNHRTMTTIPVNKGTKNNPQKKYIYQRKIQTINQLELRPNITIKKKVILMKNYDASQNTHNKVDNVQKDATQPIKKVIIPIKVTNTKKQAIVKKKEMLVEKKKNMEVQKKVELVEKLEMNAEFYPERSKRKVRGKKIRLQPKHDYKVVGTVNKRKRGTPHKGVEPVEAAVCLQPPAEWLQPPALRELPLSALVRLAEDRGLDDEDFMEILTCPSPVWWEDSGDDEIFHEDFDDESKEDTQSKNNTFNNRTLKIFGSKRSKLESILANIKYKGLKSEYNCAIERRIDNEKNINNSKRNINNMGRYNNKMEEDIDIGEHMIGINKHLIHDNMNDIEESTIDDRSTSRTRTDSSECLSDVSLNEELLNTLESIEVPVKINEDRNNEINEIVMMEIRNKPIENNELNLRVNNKRKRTRKNKNELILNDNIKVTNNVMNGTDLNIPTELPPLTKNPFKNMPNESPKSIDSVNSACVIEQDSISDTNIKFLDEYEDKKEPIEAVSVNKLAKGKDGELVTVYQIVSNKPDFMELDIEQQIKVNLVNKSPQASKDVNKNVSGINSFFKTRKSPYRSRSKYKKK